MNIRFQVDPDRLTLDDLIALEEESQSPRFIRDFMARFVVDDKGEYFEEGAAQKIVGALTLSEISGAAEQFKDAVETFTEGMVPKVTASP